MQRGFSLVELSIVLVILGLLVGGILAGQSLIRGAELRSISSDYQRYTAAVNAFRDKYFQLPGDFNNATGFWGKSAARCNGDIGTAATPGTCNGNGDGILDPFDPEELNVWQHLGMAGLVEGSYTGTLIGGNYVLGQSGPASRIPTAGFIFNYPCSVASPCTTYGATGHTFNFGGASGSFVNGAILKPEEAWNIDSKFDDGNPSLGMVMGGKGGSGASGECTSTALAWDYTGAAGSVTYLLDNTGVACRLFMWYKKF